MVKNRTGFSQDCASRGGSVTYNNRTAKSCGFTIDGYTNPGVLLWSGQSDGGTRERYIIENIREEIACTFKPEIHCLLF